MLSREHHNILSLIAATIFADKRVFAAEIEMFAKAAAKLKHLQQASPKLSEARLLIWYEENKDDIRANVAAPYFKDWFYDILEQLKSVQDKEAILDVMEKIARADGSVHISERALTALAKRYWGMG